MATPLPNLELHEALEVLRRALLRDFGARGVRVEILTSDGSTIALPFPYPECTQPAPATAPSEEDEAPDRRHSKCVDDILAVLDAKKIPLTTTRIMSELSRAGKEWSTRYVEKCLAAMVKDGTLENPEDARPRGYRLPEWQSGQS